MTAPGRIGEAEFPGSAESVGEARAFVRRMLAGRPGPVVDDVVLLTSELFTNAVRHSDSGRRVGGVVRLALFEPGDGVLRVEVADAGSAGGEPRPWMDADEESESGRGLFLVDLLAGKWGTHVRGGGRVVWFEMLRS